MNEIVLNELLTRMSNAELRTMNSKIEKILNGEIPQEKNLTNIDIYKEMKDYLKAKTIEGKSKGTLSQYKYNITNMLKKINKPVKYIKTDDIRRYLCELKENNQIQDSTLDGKRISLNSFFEWLKINGYINENPCALIKPIHYEKKEREPLTDIEMEKIRSACKTLREKAIVELLYSTGCRVSELCTIKIEDIDLKAREVHVLGKGKKHRTVFLNARAVVALTNYINNRGFQSDYVIASERSPHNGVTTRTIQIIIKTLGEKAKIAGKVFPHRIRHTTATDAINHGMPIEQVQTLLGHEKVTTTQIYAKCLKDNLKNNYFKFIV